MSHERPLTEREVASLLEGELDETSRRLAVDWQRLHDVIRAVVEGWSLERMIDGTWMVSGPDGSFFTLPDTGPVPPVSEQILERMRALFDGP